MAEANPFIQSSRTLDYDSGSGLVVNWTAEIDPVMRRLRLFKRWFGRWTKTVVDCSLDDCVSMGKVEYDKIGTQFR
jgi:hypothetical protein